MKYRVNLKTKKADIYIPKDEQYDSALIRALDRQGLDVTVHYILSATTSYRYDIVNIGTAKVPNVWNASKVMKHMNQTGTMVIDSFAETGCIVKDPSPSRYIGVIDEI